MEQQKDIFALTASLNVSEATQNLINAVEALDKAELQVHRALLQWYSQSNSNVKEFHKATDKVDDVLYRITGSIIFDECATI